MVRGRGKLKNAFISSHAVERFMERWRSLDVYDEVPTSLEEWRDRCREVLLQSNELHLGDVARVKMLIRHGGEESRYFVNKQRGLKFVLVQSDTHEDSLAVKTVLWIGQTYRPEDVVD